MPTSNAMVGMARLGSDSSLMRLCQGRPVFKQASMHLLTHLAAQLASKAHMLFSAEYGSD
jgi:hypothetical protein